MTSAPIDATAAAELFLSGARDAGLLHVCISPGSRSTPLAIAALRTPGLTTSIHLDERVAGFAALGHSLATGAPTALICTSGTAGANYLPAISEANMSNVALIALTADRPPEHWSWGVGQTFSQTGLYHQQVRAEFEMPVGGDGGEAFSARAGWRAACTSIEASGPVHVNWPFRLPLEPQDSALGGDAAFAPPSLQAVVHHSEVEALTSLLASAEAPVLIAGPGSLNCATAPGSDGETLLRSNRVHQAAKRLGMPIIADALSGLRGAADSVSVPAAALLFQRSSEVLDALSPDLIIHMGHTPTAKACRLWWETTSATHVLLDPSNDWNDPSHVGEHRFISDPVELLAAATVDMNSSQAWLDRWLEAGQDTAAIRDAVLSGFDSMTDAHVAAEVGTALGASEHLFLSSSMPVRDVDTYVPVTSTVNVHANRGINGIDGVVSTAGGFARGSDSTVTVLIGDVALLHDVGGVLDAARNQTPLVIVVANNDGGGIFSLLPIKSQIDPDHFDDLFNTAHGTNFEFLGEHPNISYQRVTEVGSALRQAHDEPQASVTIIEVPVNTEDRLDFHSELTERLSSE